MAVLVVVIFWLALSSTLLAFAFRRALYAAWREPVLRVPVLICESDDWGYGPLLQAERLDRIASLLEKYRDVRGRHPVATLGVVLAGPDNDRLRAEACQTYHRVTLADPRLAPIRDAMMRGASRGVFALQLHGMEHYWPACLMRSAEASEAIRHWLTSVEFPLTEELPSPLQSRWIDTGELPSRSLPVDAVALAAAEEIHTFAAVFGAKPEVVVPPTFVWNDAVESAWVCEGVRTVVTPGVRNESRNAVGRVIAGERTYYNAESGHNGVSYVVRNSYFEPSLGHTHPSAIQALKRNTQFGRPTLLEIHRLNFIGDGPSAQCALDELTRLLEATCAQFPDIQFMSTGELAQQYRDRSNLVETRVGARIHMLLRRLVNISRLRKLAWATGTILPAWLAYVATWPTPFRRSH
jgi:hypothetical protein